MFLNKKISLGFILLILAIALVAINTAYSANNVFIFNKNLTLGSINNDVRQLQKYLNNNNYLVAKTGPGSINKETTYFGALTKAALIKFQKANKIKPAVGYFGPITRDFINKKIKNQNANNTNNTNNNQTNNNLNNTNINYYTIGGSITGLSGLVILQNNNQDEIIIKLGSDSNFTFPTKLVTNTNYNVTIKQNYLDQNCYFQNNTGTVNKANITNIKIACGSAGYFNPFSNTGNSSTPKYALSYVAGANGTITGNTSQDIYYGSNATTVTAIPNTGYYFVTWSDGVLTAERTDTNIIANKSVTATFAINSYTLTSSAGAHGTITPTDTINYGSNKTFTITPDQGYLISDVLVDTVSVGTPTTYTFTNVTTTHTISATFVSAGACGGVNSISYGDQTYSTVSIGSQCWFGENLNIGTRVNMGSQQDNNSAIEKYCYNDDDANCTTNGGLYQWAEALQLPNDCNTAHATNNGNGTYTMNCPISGSQIVQYEQQGICPTGWHIPSISEWETLAQNADPGCGFYTTGCATAGTKLKATASHTPIAWDGTDIFHFSAIPSGYGGATDGNLWSSVPDVGFLIGSEFIQFNSDDSSIRQAGTNPGSGLSIRCLKNSIPQ